MIWIDLKERISAMVISDSYDDDKKGNFYIASRSIKATEMPDELLAAIKEWATNEKMPLIRAIFMMLRELLCAS